MFSSIPGAQLWSVNSSWNFKVILDILSHFHKNYEQACHFLYSLLIFWLRSQWTYISVWDFPGGSDGKASVYNVGDLGSIPGLGRFPGEGNGIPLQYSCLENPMDGGAWCRLLSMGSQRVGHDWTTSLHLLFIGFFCWAVIIRRWAQERIGRSTNRN